MATAGTEELLQCNYRETRRDVERGCGTQRHQMCECVCVCVCVWACGHVGMYLRVYLRVRERERVEHQEQKNIHWLLCELIASVDPDSTYFPGVRPRDHVRACVSL